VHHLLVFLLAGVLAFEVGVIRPGMRREDVLRVSRVDNWYGILAAAILIVGFLRAISAAKGWAYYEANAFFGPRSRLSPWRRLTQHSLPGALLGLTWAGLAPADRASFAWRLPEAPSS
jgi:putative membrane protein